MGQLFWIMSPFTTQNPWQSCSQVAAHSAWCSFLLHPLFSIPLKTFLGFGKTWSAKQKQEARPSWCKSSTQQHPRSARRPSWTAFFMQTTTVKATKMETTMSIETVPFTCNGTWWLFSSHFSCSPSPTATHSHPQSSHTKTLANQFWNGANHFWNAPLKEKNYKKASLMNLYTSEFQKNTR